jgi:hypothetical protein
MDSQKSELAFKTLRFQAGTLPYPTRTRKRFDTQPHVLMR